ncbi:GAF domain-containing sensor histidine kinase [Planktothricoides raciborskii]|uniref:histidine kinase n=2 Tax=Planktothricoides raciborskii TaxID=132608 RepID=A0AAU8JP39_9CYAN
MFTDFGTDISSPAYGESPDQNFSLMMAQILLNQPNDLNRASSIVELIRNTFNVDCCLMAVERSFEEPIPSKIDWYVSTSSQIQERFGSEVASLPCEDDLQLDLQPLWDAIVAEPDGVLISQAQAVFSELGVSNWLSQLEGSLIAIAAPPNRPVVGGLVLIAMQPLLWTETKMQQLNEVSSQVAIAIANLDQQRTISSYKEKVTSIRQQQNLIHQMTMAIHHWSDLDQILLMAIDKLVDSLAVEKGLILLLKYQDPLYKSRNISQGAKQKGRSKRVPRAKVVVVCQSGLAVVKETDEAEKDRSFVPDSIVNESLVNESFWLSDCPWCQQAFLNAPEPINLPNLTEESADRENYPKTMFKIFDLERMRSGINVPIIALSSGGSGNTILGFLVLQNSSDRPWSAEELKILELVGTQLGNAILQNQTLHQVQALVEDRNAQLKRAMEVQAKLYELTRQQLDQLRRLNEVKDEFLDTLNHELKTPLATMRMAIENLRRPGISPERQAMYLDMMQSQLNRETKLVNDLLKLRELEFRNSTIQLEMLDLQPFLRGLADNFRQTWSDKELTLSLRLEKKPLKIQTDPKNLEHAIVELLTNAGKYSDPATNVDLQVMQHIETGSVVIKVTNIGAGIFPADLPNIFDKFRRGQGMTQKAVAGTGLGLALVKSLISHLNGTITVTSESLQPPENADDDSVPWETCFTVTLPQQLKRPEL